ncbi:hypothetical protein PG996_010074 [Apiospora saccharicola]|uniref:Dienelactone hydrolase domain-containing protein n=1 Tax=Apiospora saccharicola TaxID=335842 RepID=A0ABR1UMJ9_9PEZI
MNGDGETLSPCCTTGHLHEGEPTGTYRYINGSQVYFKGPPNGSAENAVLLFTDAMGHGYLNNRLLADNFAANGFFVVMPDLFHGDPIPDIPSAGFDAHKWLRNHGSQQTEPIVRAVIEEMRNHGCRYIAAAGYCFGAKYVMRYLQPGALDAGFIAHPNWFDLDDGLRVQKPLCVVAGENDRVFGSQERRQMEKLLKAAGVPYQMTVYSGVQHGFAVRGDPKNAVEVFAKEQAFNQAIQWFKFHLKAGTKFVSH